MPKLTSGEKVYNSTFNVCISIPIHSQVNPIIYFCCFKDHISGFLLYIDVVNNDDPKLFYTEQRLFEL